MTVAQATKLLKEIDDTTAFRNQTEYNEILAAIIKKFPQDMKYKSSKDNAFNVLKKLAKPSTFEYLQNNSKYLRRSRPTERIPTGITVNESEHAILKSHFSNVIHQSRARLRVVLREFVVARMTRWVLSRRFNVSVGRKDSEVCFRRMLAVLSAALKSEKNLMKRPAASGASRVTKRRCCRK